MRISYIYIYIYIYDLPKDMQNNFNIFILYMIFTEVFMHLHLIIRNEEIILQYNVRFKL